MRRAGYDAPWSLDVAQRRWTAVETTASERGTNRHGAELPADRWVDHCLGCDRAVVAAALSPTGRCADCERGGPAIPSRFRAPARALGLAA